MHKKPYTFLYGIVIGVSALFLPQRLFAANVTFSVVPSTASVSNMKTVEVRIDPEAAKLNVVEGTIMLESGSINKKMLVEISTDASVLSIWPIPPRFDSTSNTISFTGGVPDGFSTAGLLFSMNISAASDVGISWLNGTSYLNDGKGTAVPITARPIVAYGVPAKDSGGGVPWWQRMISRFGAKELIGLVALISIGIACIYGYKKNHKK